MIHRVLNIGRWVIDFLFAKDDYDIDGVVACMYDIEAPRSDIRQSIITMKEREPNRGFTSTNPYLRRAVVVIGPTTSGDEFINTLVHEVRHVADAIAEELNVELYSEVPAYISGDAAMSLARVICEMGCSKCHK